MTNKHEALIAQYAEDWKETDAPWERWEYATRPQFWCSMNHHPTWGTDVVYRRKPVVHTYPALYKRKTTGMVVMASSMWAGMVVAVPNGSCYQKGFYCDQWEPFTNTEEWTRLPDEQQAHIQP